MDKLRPILFSTDMVRAIIEGRKTQTRRIFGPVPDGIDLQEWLIEHHDYVMSLSKYGAENEALWVRETWAPLGDFPKCNYSFMFKADTPEAYSKWRPSIHMPFEACRLFLRIKSMRIERLNDITEEDAIAEGVLVIEPGEAYFDYAEEAGTYATAKGSFTSLWDKINGKGSWNANPWVWVIEFEPISKEEALS